MSDRMASVERGPGPTRDPASVARSPEVVPGNREAPSKLTGVVAGTLATFAFTVFHDVWISDIWFNLGPMLFSGALCGYCIVWSYRTTTTRHSWTRWWAYNAAWALLLLGLGAASLLVQDPRFTIAEMMEADDALAQLLPPAMPLILAGTVLGSIAIWVAFGRRPSAAIPILVTQALLMFLIGHNLAILGLVEIPTDQLYRVAKFVGVTAFIAATFAAGVVLVEPVRTRLRSGSPRAGTHPDGA